MKLEFGASMIIARLVAVKAERDKMLVVVEENLIDDDLEVVSIVADPFVEVAVVAVRFAEG